MAHGGVDHHHHSGCLWFGCPTVYRITDPRSGAAAAAAQPVPRSAAPHKEGARHMNPHRWEHAERPCPAYPPLKGKQQMKAPKRGWRQRAQSLSTMGYAGTLLKD